MWKVILAGGLVVGGIAVLISELIDKEELQTENWENKSRDLQQKNRFS